MGRETARCQHTRRYHVAMAVLLAGGLLSQVAKAQELNDKDVDGEHGALYVHGLLTEGACRLDMASAWQDVEMASLTTAMLPAPGAEGTSVQVTLHLKDCIRTRGYSLETRTGVHTWDSVQPVVTVAFLAPGDLDSPSLLRVMGVKGVALRVRDASDRAIHPGERSAPQFVTPSSDQLTYTITPVRTAEPLIPGEYRAVLNFDLNYD
ncbi:type 1 fimbrial protein [Salmonella enterica]|nr:type 1 fimbrial protein [Salmonella enterica]EHH6165072.1 type 1 fimbrial protein [Salmonella enterica]EHO7416040.1 type 1 fimbrial protein [Salmonella enterica]EHP0290043.1 type 1 fimbrial protein [Salmonella enterica]EHZ6479263.1 type 1 fimbrial protein [Salmonella enterica]